MSNVVPLSAHRAPTRDQDDGLLRVIRALERTGIAVVMPGEDEDDAIERTLRALPVSSRLEQLASQVGLRTELQAREARS